MIKFVLLVTLLALATAKWAAQNHQYSPAVSAQIAEAIKKKLLAHLNQISDQGQRNKLKADLNAQDDDDRKLTKVSDQTANQIFEILSIDYPGCDKNGDGVVKGDELKCLNLAWKAYVPH